MISKRFAITIAVTVLLLALIPAYALAAGGTISGKVAIPRNATLPQYINTTTVDNVTYYDITQKIYASNLTVFAYNTKTTFSNVTFPNQDGSYSIPVSENGVYRIYIIPSTVYDLVNPSNWTPVEYPNENDRVFTVEVYGDMKNVDINYYPAGEYVATNIKANATPVPNVSATPAPGFAVLLVLAGLLGAFAIVRRNK